MKEPAMTTTTNRPSASRHVRTRRRVLLRVAAGIAALLTLTMATAVTVGMATTTTLTTVTRTTTASPEAIWDLWAQVPDRTRWDSGLEWATIEGPFELGARGEVKLVDQPAREFEIVEYEPMRAYTDRFFLPMGTHMDWHHTITELPDGQREVTFHVEVTGPTALVVGPIAGNILEEELPATVDELVSLAEASE
jgi:hypothetical protein